MVDEPGPGELRRSYEQLRLDMRDGFAGINARLDRLVTSETFAAEQRRVDDKLKDLADDIAAEREQRQADRARETKARETGDQHSEAALEKLTTTIRWVAASVIIPVILFVGNILMNRGGS